jgi:hypothetical protein
MVWPFMRKLVRQYDEAQAEGSKDPETGHANTSGIEEDA